MSYVREGSMLKKPLTLFTVVFQERISELSYKIFKNSYNC